MAPYKARARYLDHNRHKIPKQNIGEKFEVRARITNIYRMEKRLESFKYDPDQDVGIVEWRNTYIDENEKQFIG